MESVTCTIDGFGPLPVIRPISAAELGKLVRGAAAKGEAIYPIGGQTQLDLGNPPMKPGVAVDMRGLDQVIDFPARDMTITVQSGITIAKLQALLAAENLRLPIDVSQSERATLGGILATNVSGPRRYGYGTLRDYVIGISAVNDEGNEFKAGGRVVKNVAGYDLCKLLIGSLGTLGVITQVTLKLRPLAEETALVTMGSDSDNLGLLLEQLHFSQTRPVSIELLNQSAAQQVFAQANVPCPDVVWTLVIGYEGNAELVNWQVQQLVKEQGATKALDIRLGISSNPLWQALVNWPTLEAEGVVYRLVAKPNVVVGLCQLSHALFFGMSVRAHAGNGIMQIAGVESEATRIDNDAVTPAAAANARLKFMLHSMTDVDGNIGIVRCPNHWKSSLAIWGREPANLRLMRAVKRQFDPKGLFNPGRFVGGI